jgi:hypothetical protein
MKLGKLVVDPRLSEVDDLYYVFQNECFSDRLGGVAEGYYSTCERSASYDAAYSGYNRWRNMLAELAGYPIMSSSEESSDRRGADVGAWNASSGPFWELINFSDCEGFIGGSVAEKIANDFAEYEQLVSGFEALDPTKRLGFEIGYKKLKAAFDFAVEHNGVVGFS